MELRKDLFAPEGVTKELAAIRVEYEGIVKTLKPLIQSLKETNKSFTGAKSITDLRKGTTELTKAQNELIKQQKLISDAHIKEQRALQALAKAEQEKLKSTQQLQRAEQQRLKTEIEAQKVIQAKARTEIQARKEGERLAKQEERAAKQAKDAASAYKQLSNRLNEARQKYKDLAASGTASTKQLRAQQRVVQNLDNRVKKIDASVGQFQRNVGNYPRLFGSATNALKGFLGAFGLIGGIQLFARTLQNTVKLFADFEKANSNLAAVSGATATQMAAMRGQARQLGETTAFSASQVTGLQVELAKLGFPIQDIQNMTASTLDAALAMGSGLADTAKLAGATLKAFRLDSSQAARVNDVLAKATASSALDFEKLNNSMSTIAPVANAFGFALEDTVALLGELSNAGFDASSAATATRNILLNLADANGELAKKIGEPVKDLPSLVAGLGKLESQGIDLAQALELTDRRSVAAFSTFLSGRSSVLALGNTLRNASGSAREMARVMEDNLLGDVKLFRSAWEGLVLSLTAGDSVFNKVLRTTVQLATSFLSLITPTEKVNRGFEEQRDFVNDLDSTLPGFISRYDELVKKTNRNADENEELRKVTEKIAEIVPTAVTEWNKYGEALGINTTKAEDFLTAQRDLLKVKNKERIEELEESLVDLEESLSFVTGNMNKGTKTVQEYSVGLGNVSRTVKLTDEELREMRARQLELNSELNGTRLLLLELTGDVEKYGKTIKDDVIDPTDDGTDKTDDFAESIKKLGIAFANSLRGKGVEELLELQEELKKKQAELILQFDEIGGSSVDNVEDMTTAQEELKRQLDLVGKQLTFIDHAFSVIPEHVAEWESLQKAIEGSGKSLEDFVKNFETANQKFINSFSTEDLNKLSDPVDNLVDRLISEGGDAAKGFADDYKTAMGEVAAAIDFIDEQDKKADEKRKKRQELAIESLNLLGEIYRGFADLRIQQISDELNALQHKRDREIEFIQESGATEEQKEARIAAVNAKFDARERQLKQQQARSEKQAALFQIAINTAVGVASALKTPALIPFIVALGAAQAAFVAAQPLPKFKEGVKDAKGGPAIVSEEGSELLINKGKAYLTPKRPSIIDVPEHADIIPHDLTMKILANSLARNISRDSRSFEDERIVNTMNRRFRSLEKTIRRKPSSIIVGQKIGNQIGETKIRKINQLRF